MAACSALRSNHPGFALRCLPVNSIDPKKLDQPEKAEDEPLKEVEPTVADTSSDATIEEIERLREKQGNDEEEPEDLPLKEQE